MSKSKKIIFIVGPTASGKSSLSYDLVASHEGAIVNCDSLQVYESLNIGSAKPNPQELSRCPHYLFGHVPDGQDYTAGKFRTDAMKIIQQSNHDHYFFVGGSGFYIRALTTEMFEETPIKKEIKDKVNHMRVTLGKDGLFSYLSELDPDYARRIHENDSYRVGRALELILSLGKSMKELQTTSSKKKNEFQFPHRFLGVNPGREALRSRIAERLDKMLELGFRSEVEALLKRGLENWKPLNSVGYKEMRAWIRGELNEESFKQEVIKNTMRLAKRQMTWFKKNKSIDWVSDLDSSSQILRDFLFPH